MGYNEDASSTQAELDAIKHKEYLEAQKDPAEKKIKAKKGMTKEEQEALLQKMGAY